MLPLYQMARQTANRRQYQRRPGLKEASAALGVNYSHLRRVLAGKRVSLSLVKRYQQLAVQAQPSSSMSDNPRFSTGPTETPNPSPHPAHFEPAWDNFSEAWLESVSKLGFMVVCIQFKLCPLGYEQSEFITSLGAHFASAGLGHFDSSQWQGKILHFFYADAKRLIEALEFLKSKLGEQDLLPISGIGYMDISSRIWRQFYPGADFTPT